MPGKSNASALRFKYLCPCRRAPCPSARFEAYQSDLLRRYFGADSDAFQLPHCVHPTVCVPAMSENAAVCFFCWKHFVRRRAHVTPRFLRHFNVIGYVDMSDDDKRVIFRTILDNFLSTGFEPSLARYARRCFYIRWRILLQQS